MRDDRHPRPRAAALSYDRADRAPRVVAKGEGRIAEEILARAREAGVPIHASRELSAMLLQVQLDDTIPPQLYVAVAEVLAWAYRIEHGDQAASAAAAAAG